MLENYFKLRKRTFMDYKRVSVNRRTHYYVKKRKRKFLKFRYIKYFTVYAKYRFNKKSTFFKKFRLLKKKGRFYGNSFGRAGWVLNHAQITKGKKRLTKLYKNKLIVSTTQQAIKMMVHVYISTKTNVPS